MADAFTRSVADTFIDAIALLELDHRHDRVEEWKGVRYFHYPNGRAGSSFSNEFFPLEVPAIDTIRLASSIAGESPHLVIPIGESYRAEKPTFETAGYVQTNEWMLMSSPLDKRWFQSGDERAQLVEELTTEAGIIAAMEEEGGSGHPTKAGLAGNPRVRQRWIEEDGQPASFGRLVLNGSIAYLGDVVTPAMYRRRGHAGSIVRRLLDDAIDHGATQCVLTSTAMGRPIYANMGFSVVAPVFEFEFKGRQPIVATE